MRIFILLFLSVSCICAITQAQTKNDWEEWEGLFNGMSGNPNLTNTELGFVTSFYQLDVSFKRQKEYFGEYTGYGQEFGIYFQPNLVGQVDLRASLMYSQYAFRSQDSIINLNVNLGLVRLPLSLVYTAPWKIIEPQISLGFNLGHLVRRGGYIFYRSEDVLPRYWASTITSGLHGGIALQKTLPSNWVIRLDFGMSLDVVNPFDKFTSRHLQLAIGRRW
ncbi:MAG: hypothetical protein AAF927_15655 [Bacteroidota bacterium]